MENLNTINQFDKFNSSNMIEMSRDAFALIKEGKENEAHDKFPAEYHFIKKYDAVNIDELIQLLNRKLEVF